jgi:phytoene/squalene synthetase
MDLIRTKLYAACDRIDDISDLVAMQVTPTELKEASEWVLVQDASELWPQILDECKAEILKRLNNKAKT